MVYTYTDKQLNELNDGKNVYSVNSEYAEIEEMIMSKDRLRKSYKPLFIVLLLVTITTGRCFYV